MFTSIREKFKLVKDFRKAQGKRHSLESVLTIILLSLICGKSSYKEIEIFLKENQVKLRNFLNITSGNLPSYSTIRRVMMGVNTNEIKSLIKEIIKIIYLDNESKDWIAIDGKSLRSTVNNYSEHNQNMLTIVSLFSQNTNLVIGTESFESKKGSEIKQVQDLIRDRELTNKVITLDALHCNKDTTREIIASNNDYLITVKRNQVKLHNQLKELSKNNTPLTSSEFLDISHGREVNRKISVFEGKFIKHKSYPHIKSFIKVERTGKRGKKDYQQTLYYISSLALSAEEFGKRIQGHWLIENRLHWVKDVIYKEDKQKIKDVKAMENFSSLITIVLNFYRFLGFVSIKKGQYWLGTKWQQLFILEQAFG